MVIDTRCTAHLKLLGACLDSIGCIWDGSVSSQLFLKPRDNPIHLLDLVFQFKGSFGPDGEREIQIWPKLEFNVDSRTILSFIGENASGLCTVPAQCHK